MKAQRSAASSGGKTPTKNDASPAPMAAQSVPGAAGASTLAEGSARATKGRRQAEAPVGRTGTESTASPRTEGPHKKEIRKAKAPASPAQTVGTREERQRAAATRSKGTHARGVASPRVMAARGACKGAMAPTTGSTTDGRGVACTGAMAVQNAPNEQGATAPATGTAVEDAPKASGDIASETVVNAPSMMSLETEMHLRMDEMREEVKRLVVDQIKCAVSARDSERTSSKRRSKNGSGYNMSCLSSSDRTSEWVAEVSRSHDKRVSEQCGDYRSARRAIERRSEEEWCREDREWPSELGLGLPSCARRVRLGHHDNELISDLRECERPQGPVGISEQCYDAGAGSDQRYHFESRNEARCTDYRWRDEPSRPLQLSQGCRMSDPHEPRMCSTSVGQPDAYTQRGSRHPSRTHNWSQDDGEEFHLSRSQAAARKGSQKDLPAFKGDPEKWPRYSTLYRQTKRICGSTDEGNTALQQAVIEKFALCEDQLAKLLEWITRVEQDIAAVGGPKEQVDDLRNQINSLKQMKEDIDAQSRPVAACLDQVRQLVLIGGDVLSAPEVAALETFGRELRSRVDKAQDRTGKLLCHLDAARYELGKLRSELDTFSSCLQTSRRTLEEKESTLSDLHDLPSQSDSVKEFHSDVIAHQADLCFITMSAQKFVDECKDYLGVLNDFCTTLPERLPHIEQVSSSDSPIRQEVQLATAQYRDLLNRTNTLLDRLAGLGSRQRDYQEALEKVRSWLRDVHPRVSSALSDPIAANPEAVQDQMNQTKALQSEFLSQGRLIGNVQHSLGALLKSLTGRLSPSKVSALEIPVEEVKDKYNQLLEAVGDRSKLLDTALVQSQSVQDALDGLAGWINQSEEKFKIQNRPASLIKDRLNEQVHEHRGLLNDLESHRTSQESVTLSAQELSATPSNTRLAKRIESNQSDVTGRFEKLLDKALKRGEFLEDTLAQLSKFMNDFSNLEQELTALNDALEGRELVSLSAEVLAEHMVELSRLKKKLGPQYNATVRLGKDLVATRDVTNTGEVRDRVKALESMWKTMDTTLEDKLKLSRQKAEQPHAYEDLKNQVHGWLGGIETSTNNLAPVAVDVEAIKYQIEEVRSLVKEHREYGVTIDRVNDLGAQYDALIRPDSPTRKRSGYSPIKRSNVSPMRRLAGDVRSPSPTKGGAPPLSPASGSSGFGGQRSSQDGFHLTDLTPIQQQLTEINNRYRLVGARLNDRQNELESVRDEVRKSQDQ